MIFNFFKNGWLLIILCIKKHFSDILTPYLSMGENVDLCNNLIVNQKHC